MSTIKIATGNRLIDGVAVWLAPDGSWTDDIDAAEQAADAAAAERLERLGKAAIAENRIVDLALVDVQVTADGLRPIRLRERIRAQGPTTHPQFGKQARLLQSAS